MCGNESEENCLTPSCAATRRVDSRMRPCGGGSRPHSKDTAYRVDDSPSGFTLYVQQAHYQFVLNDEIQASCSQVIKSLAHEIGESRGHKIEFDNQHVKMSFGRNGVNGISSCTAMVPVIWTDREIAEGNLSLSP